MNNLYKICAMKMHIGRLIKEKAISMKISVPELATKVPTGRRNMYRILKEDDMLVSQLYRISRALKYDIFKDIKPLEDLNNSELTVLGEEKPIYKKTGKELTIHFDVSYNIDDAENLGAFMMHVDSLGEQFGFRLL